MNTSGLVAAINQLLAGAVPVRSTKAAALAEIANFNERTTPSPWKLDRSLMTMRLQSLVDDPRKVRQGAIGSCGPAAFLRCWIAEDPLAFAKFATELYETGKGTLGTMTIEPDAELLGRDWETEIDAVLTSRHPKEPRLHCPSADWMVMSSMLDDRNRILDFEGSPDETWSQGSYPWDIATWFEALGHDVDWWMSFDPEEFLWQLSPIPGKRHILFTANAAMFDREPTGFLGHLAALARAPNHIVVLDTPLSKGFDGKIRLQAWTWGHYPTTTYLVTEDDLTKWVSCVFRAER